jgi:hypothetical protein
MFWISKASTCGRLSFILLAMSDTAHDYQTTSAATTDGMDDLFGQGLAENQKAKPQGSAAAAGHDLGSADGLASWFSIEDASRRLGISKNAIQKRLKRGKLIGKKTSGPFGDIWLVDLSSENQVLEIQFENQEDSVDAEEAKPSGSASNGEELKGSAKGLASRTEVDFVWQMELLSRVERLSLENGQLKALLHEREKEVKLLTDSQHKPGWWTRFSNWFLKPGS